MVEETISKSISCHGCANLESKSDGAGGGLYYCKNRGGSAGGLVIGSYGHWTDERDEPKALEDDCYRKNQ